MMVKIVKDSISPQGIRLTTFHLRYWRAIHAELMTHRDFGRNARSSRAVPSRVLLTEPIFTPNFGLNQPGMQASQEAVDPQTQQRWKTEWQSLAELCRKQVEKWQEEGMHKQWANRPLEWFGWIDVLVTATRYENFFALRISEYAQPEFDELARGMKDELDLSEPQLLQPGEWHLPYIRENEKLEFDLDTQLRLSTARCARLSYKPFDGEANLKAELKRYEKLVVSRPVHASPAEHQATPDVHQYHPQNSYWRKPALHGNLHGWIQYRKTLAHEVVRA